MKKIILSLALVLCSALYKDAYAQVKIDVNIADQPVWGPAGYDHAEYYYLPDMDVYYHIPDRQFIYLDGRDWVSAYSLPPYYNRYDLYNSYKVVINEPRPFTRNDYWRSRYYSYKGRPQAIIYNSREPKYYVIKEHPEHERWVAGSYNNDRRYNDNRQGNSARYNDPQNDHRGQGNNQKYEDFGRNDQNRNGRYPNDSYTRSNDNRRWNDNNQRGNENGKFNGGRGH